MHYISLWLFFSSKVGLLVTFISKVGTLLCKKICRNRGLNVLHLPTSNSIIMSFRCFYCLTPFTSISSLTRHMEESCALGLDDLRPPRLHVCCFCDKTFKRPETLSLHMRTHTEERPHECSECGMKFRQEGQLSDHIKSHSGEKPFKCTHCDQAFVQQSNLISHMRTHSGEKPYICTNCGDAFRRSTHLQQHYLLHLPDRPTFTCPACGSSYSTRSALTRHRSKKNH